MAQIEIKNFDSPDETRPFEGKGKADVLNIGGGVVGKAVFEPGWKWSENVKPIAGTDRTFEITILDAEAQAYVFTFG